MWALIYKEFVQMRTYLLQVLAVMVLVVVLFGNSLEGFILSYLGILPLVIAMTFPQFLFSMEERGNTLVFLRSLPVRPRQIVAGKYITSVIVVAGLMLFVLGYATTIGKLDQVLVRTGPSLIVAAILLGYSMYLHFRLGTNSAKVALLVSLMALSLLGMGVMQNQAWIATISASPVVQTLLAEFDSAAGALTGLAIAVPILWLSFMASAQVFTRQDISRMH